MIIATMLNNIVTHISTISLIIYDVAFWSIVGRASTSVPWVIVGGFLPLVIGGLSTHGRQELLSLELLL
ncbi:unnamed protein product [Brassica rapa subsp. trilocularis]